MSTESVFVAPQARKSTLYLFLNRSWKEWQQEDNINDVKVVYEETLSLKMCWLLSVIIRDFVWRSEGVFIHQINNKYLLDTFNIFYLNWINSKKIFFVFNWIIKQKERLTAIN